MLLILVEAGGESARGMGKKIFVGRLPQEASVEDLRMYFGRFGRILDVYVPKVTQLSILCFAYVFNLSTYISFFSFFPFFLLISI